MMVIGAGHTILHFTVKGKNPAGAHVVAQMDQYRINIAGLGSRSLLEYHEGFSLSMGIILLCFGLQNCLVSENIRTNRGLILVALLTAGVMFFLSLRYFIIIPQALSFIALIAYGMCFWKGER